ncbi:MAG: peptidylprolyl isomerase, partial [Rhodanobacter sp.]
MPKFLLASLLLILSPMLAAQTAKPDAPAAANPQVVIHTSQGDITLELFPDKAPKSVANFLQYVREGFYAGTVFH